MSAISKFFFHETEYLSVYSRSIDEHQDEFIDLLRESVAIRSVSADPARRGDCIRMSEWARDVSSVRLIKGHLLSNLLDSRAIYRSLTLPHTHTHTFSENHTFYFSNCELLVRKLHSGISGNNNCNLGKSYRSHRQFSEFMVRGKSEEFLKNSASQNFVPYVLSDRCKRLETR